MSICLHACFGSSEIPRKVDVIPSLVCFIASVSACANGIKHLKGIDAAPRLQGNATTQKQTKEKGFNSCTSVMALQRFANM